MKLVDFIEQVNKLGYTDETELLFGFLNEEQGEYYICEVKSIDDDNRKGGYDEILVEFEKPEDYIRSEVEVANIDLREELINVVNKYL